MNIEWSIIRSLSVFRTAFCGHLSLWVSHKNEMEPSSLNQQISLLWFSKHFRISLPTTVREFWNVNNHQNRSGSRIITHTSPEG